LTASLNRDSDMVVSSILPSSRFVALFTNAHESRLLRRAFAMRHRRADLILSGSRASMSGPRRSRNWNGGRRT
jgi:hypothetical protein